MIIIFYLDFHKKYFKALFNLDKCCIFWSLFNYSFQLSLLFNQNCNKKKNKLILIYQINMVLTYLLLYEILRL